MADIIVDNFAPPQYCGGMDDSRPQDTGSRAQRDERLKAALRANIARRKAQTRARQDGGADRTGGAD